jgi:drug/metabolite transporter (DMT)-like permease
VLLGLIGGIGMYFMTQAYRYAAAAVIAPFDYTALVWGTLIGWLVWQELPGAHVWLGAAVVIASGLYIIHRETRARR